MSGHRRLAMNGSQPCLMVMSGDPAGLHHQGPMFHHYYHHHLHPSVDMSGYDADYMFHDRAQMPEVHGSFVGHQHAARLAGSQPCLFMGTDPNQTFVQAQPVQASSESQPRRKSSCRTTSGQKVSEDQRTRLKRSESFSVPATWGVLPPPPPPVPSHFGREESGQLATPSLSPLAVVRNKRANQVRRLISSVARKFEKVAKLEKYKIKFEDPKDLQ